MAAPNIKFEPSPVESLADSFTSSPGALYPSHLDESRDMSEVMTPPYDEDANMFRADSLIPGDNLGSSIAGTPAPEKKPVKKRKSWGQQLPEPKTNLPPRKRAKTEDEKEQRRVERVLRNRRAAQSSRERKRQEVEALENEKRMIERRNQDLEMRLAQMEADYLTVKQENEQLKQGMSAFRSSSVTSSPRQAESLRQSPVPSLSLSQPLFTSQDDQRSSLSHSAISEISPRTVNPASLSPEMRPVAEPSNASSSDMTQHPAAVLCDLQCQSEGHRPWTSATISQLVMLPTLILMASQNISSLLSPLYQILDSLNRGSSLSPTNSIVNLIIWIATTKASLTATSTTGSNMTKSHSLRPMLSLRIQLLIRLLSCSPHLARPLLDATREPLRSAFERQLARDCLNRVDVRDGFDSNRCVSWESLMAFRWAVMMFEKGQTRKMRSTVVRESSGQRHEAFRTLDVIMRRRETDSGSEGSAGKKSLGDWRLEL